MREISPDFSSLFIDVATLAGDISPVDFRNIFVKNIRIIGSTLRSKTPEEKGELLSELVEKTWCKFESGEVKVKIYKKVFQKGLTTSAPCGILSVSNEREVTPNG